MEDPPEPGRAGVNSEAGPATRRAGRAGEPQALGPRHEQSDREELGRGDQAEAGHRAEAARQGRCHEGQGRSVSKVLRRAVVGGEAGLPPVGSGEAVTYEQIYCSALACGAEFGRWRSAAPLAPLRHGERRRAIPTAPPCGPFGVSFRLILHSPPSTRCPSIQQSFVSAQKHDRKRSGSAAYRVPTGGVVGSGFQRLEFRW